MKEQNIEVVKTFGAHCVGVDDGDRLFSEILPVLKSGGKVHLDFSNVLTITSSFLNASVGKLFGQFDNNSFEARLEIVGLDSDDQQLKELVISNAKQHFSKTKEARKVERNIVDGINSDEK